MFVSVCFAARLSAARVAFSPRWGRGHRPPPHRPGAPGVRAEEANLDYDNNNNKPLYVYIHIYMYTYICICICICIGIGIGIGKGIGIGVYIYIYIYIYVYVHQRVELVDAVLQRRAGDAPIIYYVILHYHIL